MSSSRSIFDGVFGREEDRAPAPRERIHSASEPRYPLEDDPSAAGELRKGDRISRGMRVLDVLGWGRFSITYLIELSETEPAVGLPVPLMFRWSQKCVLKTFRHEYLAHPQAQQRFREEVQVLVESGRHPHLLYCQGLYEIAGRLYIATEYIAPNADGLSSLEGYLQCRPPDLAQTLRWAIQCCHAMEYAYAMGLRCHGDLKPTNILISRDRTAKIGDMGLVGVLERAQLADGIQVGIADGRVGLSGQTLEGSGFGTPTHMPPEQFTDIASCDERSDVYAFGVVLYQMVTGGELPFPAALPRDPSPAGMVRFWQEMQRLHATARIPQLDSPLSPIVNHCLAKRPGERYQRFRELRGELESLLEPKTGEVVRPPMAYSLSAEDWCRKGDCLATLGHWEQALACYDRALAANPRLVSAWDNKGRCLEDQGRHEEALACYDQARALKPQSLAAWHNQGSLLAKRGRLDEAIACFDQVLELDPNRAAASFNKGLCLAKLGRREEAIACYDRAAASDPRSAAPWHNKGLCLCELGRREEALVCYDWALSIDPRCATTWFNKGLCLDNMGRQEEAMVCYDQAVSLDPTLAVAWHNQGAILLGLGRNDEALACCDRDVACDPQNAYAWYNKALAEERTGRLRDAMHSYERFVALAPATDVTRIEKAQRRIRELRGQVE